MYIYVHMYVCMYVCMYTYIYIYIYRGPISSVLSDGSNRFLRVAIYLFQ